MRDGEGRGGEEGGLGESIIPCAAARGPGRPAVIRGGGKGVRKGGGGMGNEVVLVCVLIGVFRGRVDFSTCVA